MGARTIGIDTGGTFTDLALDDNGEFRVAKVPSTPAEPAAAVESVLATLGGGARRDHVVHGTTVALNALLTGRTARIALVTNEGFRDLIELGRQARPDIYALHPVKPDELVPRARRFEIAQRIWPRHDGEGFETVREPDEHELAELRARIEQSGARSIAICLLHSWSDPAIEERIAAALRGLEVPVTCSASVLAEHREFERFSTGLVNAALAPLMHGYLTELEPRLGGARLSVLQSNGGTLTAEQAAREPVRVILSGPAGGVVGAARAAGEAGLGAFVGLDMGGTSTDVSFHAAPDAEPAATRSLEPVRIAGHPVGVPTLDIHTIGCGGGSRVTVDAGGVMHVGPESAGADPGPVCYGRSDTPTVTDAHVFLGHIAAGRFLAGDLDLDHDAVARAFERLAAKLGSTALAAARGVLDVARAAMRRAIGVMTMQRGQDPGRLALVAFGGAGGLHAAALAESLRIPTALVPRHPGALSARGMTAATPVRDATRTVLAPLSSWSAKRRRSAHASLARLARASLAESGHGTRGIETTHGLDLRYRGQSFEIRLPDTSDLAASFHAAHEDLYGYALPDREVELVCLRTRAAIPQRTLALPRPRRRALPASATVGRRPAYFDRRRMTPVIDRSALAPGVTFLGPALVEEYSGTTLVPPAWRATVTPGGHLRLTETK